MPRLVVPALILALSSIAPTQASAAEPSDARRVARPEPPKGRGLYAAGIFGVSFGIFNIGYGIPLSIEGPGDAFFSGTIPIAFGSAFVLLGSLGIHYGKRRRAVWAAWHEDPSAPLLEFPRPHVAKHVPWLIVGGTTMAFGLGTIALMIPPLTDPVLNTPLFAEVATPWGAVSVVVGAAMLTVGGVRRRRALHPRERDIELTPAPWARRDGFGLALAGRF